MMRRETTWLTALTLVSLLVMMELSHRTILRSLPEWETAFQTLKTVWQIINT